MLNMNNYSQLNENECLLMLCNFSHVADELGNILAINDTFEKSIIWAMYYISRKLLPPSIPQQQRNKKRDFRQTLLLCLSLQTHKNNIATT